MSIDNIIPYSYMFCQIKSFITTIRKCCVTIDVRPPQLKKDLNPDIILITTKKLIRKDLDR